MRKRWLALVLGLVPSMCWAQCQPTNNPTLDLSNSAALTPSQYASQGGITATIAVDGGAGKSHSMTVTPGTVLTISWTSANATSAQVYWLQNNTKLGPYTYPLSGSQTWTATGPGTTYVWQYMVSGSGSSQDRITVVVVPGNTPNIVNQDSLPTNSYMLASLNYNGTPNIPYQTTCTNAAEKDMLPTAQLNLSNTSSGENRAGVSSQGATTVVGQSVSATVYDYISFLPATVNNGVSFPGDAITVGAGGFVYCSAIGDFWQGWKNFQGTAELAVTFSQVTGFVGQNASLRQWCLLADIPPDYNPNILLNAQPGATYAWGTALLFNSTWNSGTWLVFGPGLAYSLTGTYTRKPCTHNPPPY